MADGCLCVTCYKPMIEDNATLQGKLDTALAALEQAEARSSAVHLLIDEFGSYDGEHHKQWVLDQIARTIQGREGYARWRKSMVLQTKEDENGLDHWDEGIAP